VEGSCEYGIEPSASINFCEVLEWLHNCAVSQEGLRSMKLVNSHTKFHMYNDSLPKLSYRLYSRLNEMDAYTPYGSGRMGLMKEQ
jgi:hypothetical protein